jgi:hypothetical protein
VGKVGDKIIVFDYLSPLNGWINQGSE